LLEAMQLLSRKMNVTGSEEEIIAFLKEELSEVGDVFVDPMGSLVVTVGKDRPSEKSVMVCTTVDVPGFLCLYSEKGESVLVPTSPLKADAVQNQAIISDKGTRIRLPETLKDTNEISVKTSNISLGNVFQFDEGIHREETLFRGFYASKYALISILSTLAKETMKDQVSFCFCTQGESRAKSEANLIQRLKPDVVLFLTDMESTEKSPLLLIKDGAAISDPALRQRILSQRTKTIPTVTEKAVSKMESCLLPNRRALALALPTVKRGTHTQEVSQVACKHLYRLVKDFLRKI